MAIGLDAAEGRGGAAEERRGCVPRGGDGAKSAEEGEGLERQR